MNPTEIEWRIAKARELDAKARELDAKATKGPLSVHQPDVDGILQAHFLVNAEGRYTPVAKVQSETMNLTLAKANAQLFATYRTLCPDLANDCEKLIAENERLKADKVNMQCAGSALFDTVNQGIAERDSLIAALKVAREALTLAEDVCDMDRDLSDEWIEKNCREERKNVRRAFRKATAALATIAELTKENA